MNEPPVTVAEGRFLRLLQRRSWEYVERVNVADVAVLVPITAANEIVLVEQYRIPVEATMIELPAGSGRGRRGFPRREPLRRGEPRIGGGDRLPGGFDIPSGSRTQVPEA